MHTNQETKSQMTHTPRQIADMIDKLVSLRISITYLPAKQHTAINDQIEQIKRDITDYLLETNPNKGVYVDPKL